MFCVAVINKQLLYNFWEKNTGIENTFKIRKKSTKNHVDSCYYAMLPGRNDQ